MIYIYIYIYMRIYIDIYIYVCTYLGCSGAPIHICQDIGWNNSTRTNNQLTKDFVEKKQIAGYVFVIVMISDAYIYLGNLSWCTLLQVLVTGES